MPAPVSRVGVAPGRVTLIGEHTDYNEGCALGVATQQRTTVVAQTDDSGRIEVTSAACGEGACSLGDVVGEPFVVIAAALSRALGVGGARLRVESDLPVGAGLSSSAAYAVAVALSLGSRLDELATARMCQAAEHLAGSETGLLDQLVILAAREARAVDIDFAVPTVRTVAMSDAIGISVVDTGERRVVARTDYAKRRRQCAEAARVIGPLGRAAAADLDWLGDEVLRRRARHVIAECGRVRAARPMLELGDLAGFGEILDEGHASLREDFEVSTPLVEEVRGAVRALPGVAGARLSGAGFGGCLVVAHDPGAVISIPGTFCARVVPGGGAELIQQS